MFPSFIGILDIQSWWEVPSIAHFCSLFRAAFNLLDFDIEELEEALLTDGTEETASSLLTELIVRLLCGCFGSNDISAFNYQMFLRRLFRQKCQETGRYNPFNTDIDFQFLPLRTKVEILYALCDFRLDADDVFDLFKNLEAESLRVEPLGWDSNSSAYWYFYGTRLYREDYKVKPKSKKRKKEDKKSKSEQYEDDTERVWQVVCFTESDWINLAEKFKGSSSKLERDLYQSLSENFLPEIPRLFQEKERLQRKRLLESAPRRTSTRVQIKQKQKEEEESKLVIQDIQEKNLECEIKHHKKKTESLERESRVRRREQLRTISDLSASSDSSKSCTEDDNKEMRHKRKKRKIQSRESSVPSPPTVAPSAPPKPTGRQTNNSLACATGQIVIPDIKEPLNPTRKKVKSSQIYELLDQDLVIDMYKVLEQLKSNDDAWPFMDPVEEDYAPNYYTVIRRPMDLKRMEDRLDRRYYTNFSMFKNDFKLIVNNCRLYNGQESEYTKMVNNLEIAFIKLTQRYFEGESSSDDEIAIVYPIENRYSRKHSVDAVKRSHRTNIKNDEDSQREDEVNKILEKCKSDLEDDNGVSKPKKSKSSSKDDEKSLNLSHDKKDKEKVKGSRLKKKKKLKRLQEARKSRKDKHKKEKVRGRRKHSKHGDDNPKKEKRGRKALSEKQVIRSRSNSRSSLVDEKHPVAVKRHLSPEIDFYKDKFDKIKERRRGCVKKFDDFSGDKIKEKKSNLPVLEKDKHLNLKETIEKLKAKSENVKPPPIYNNLYSTEEIPPKKEKRKFADFDSPFDDVKKNTGDEYEFVDDDEVSKENNAKQQVNTKNESAREALEQAMKDINKWLDDTPKLSEFGSNSNSPIQIPLSDDYGISPIVKPDDETSNSQTEKEKMNTLKKEGTRKRQTNKETPKPVTKKKEVQRTIDRLQPGKSKGNLITNIQTTTKQEENIITPLVKAKELKNSLTVKCEEGSPKLSLGTVLPTVGFGLGKQHNFTPDQNSSAVKVEVVDMGTMTGENEEPPKDEDKSEAIAASEEIEEKEVEPSKTEEPMKQCQEKATPNLSAWFKAFGTPKSVAPSTPVPKKKTDDYEQEDLKINDDKNTSPLDSVKNDQGDDLLAADGSESPIGNSGSEHSEHSSQGLDSPRHQVSQSYPPMKSPASPRTEDPQKPYPFFCLKVNFYQDTTSVKSSPEKSCSPREAPQSPYANYSQHVYASSGNGNNSNNSGSAYPADGTNKSPIPAYAQSPYYENVKSNVTKPNQEDYPAYSSDNAYQKPSSPFPESFSPGKSPYHSQHSPYSLVQSPQTCAQNTPTTVGSVMPLVERKPILDKSSAFPVKKRSYDISKDSTEDEACIQVKPPSTPIVSDISAGGGIPSDESYSNPDVTSNPSVITSALTKQSKPTTPGFPCDPANLRGLPKQVKDDFQSKALHSQYPEYASDYSLKKSHASDYSLAGLSKSNSEANPSSINTFQESQYPTQPSSFGDIKNIPKSYPHDYSGIEKPVVTVNMGYSGKVPDNMKGKDSNVDMINMGYSTQPDAHAHLPKHLATNSEDLRNLSNYYNSTGFPYSGRMEHGKVPSASNDYNLDTSKRFGVYNDKLSSVLQYMKSTESDNPTYDSDSLQLNHPNLPRGDISRQNVLENPDNLSRNATTQMYQDWLKKNQETRKLSLYKDSQNKIDSRMSVPQMATSSVSNLVGKSSDSGSYDSPNSGTAQEEATHKKELIVQPNSRVPCFRAVIEISSSIKPESQPPVPEYNLRRNVSLNLPVTSTKTDSIDYDRSAPLTTSNSYKPSAHSQGSTEQPLLNIPNLPQIMERYKEERMLSSFPATSVSSATYQDKNLPLMFPKGMNSVPSPYGRVPDNLYSQSSQSSSHIWPTEPISLESDKKSKSKKKKSGQVASSTPPSTNSGQSYQSYSTSKTNLPSSEPVMSLKPPNLLSGSAFNFGLPGSLASSLYGDSSHFLDPSTNQYMAANYIAAHQRSTPDIDKGGKPAHSPAPYQFLSPQARPTYPLVGMESPTLYQHYIQRQQEDMLRPLHPHIMGMFPPGYNPSLGGRQPFDSIPRPWL